MASVAHKYMPGEVPIEETKATFAVRQDTLDFALQRLREQAKATSLTSFLLTGPRGAGKTTLVLMIEDAIKHDAILSQAFLPVRFPEELPHVTSLRDLLAEALRTLDQNGVPDAGTWYQQAEAQDDDEQSLQTAVTGLRSVATTQGQRIVLLLENLDTLFDQALSETEEATLRRLLMDHPFLMILGTALRVFPALKDYAQPFFNYFNEIPLERLDDADVRQILLARAEFDGNDNFKAVLDRHDAKVRSITLLTGGNPRLVLMLYELLDHQTVAEVVPMLRQLLDDLTPLLNGVLERLTGQQRKVLDALMRENRAAQPKDLAEAARLPLRTVTAQLTRLKEAQIVEVQGGGKGRSAHYTVPDRLFSTWYQMRYLRRNRRRIEFFVEIIRTWFEPDERYNVLRGIVSDDSRCRSTDAQYAEYLTASLRDTSYFVDACDFSKQMWVNAGKPVEAEKMLEDLGVDLSRVTEIEPRSDSPAANRTDLPRMSAKQKASDLIARGFMKGRTGDLGGALADYDAVLDLRDTPADLRTTALLNRGVIRAEQGDLDGEVADYNAVLASPGVPAEHRAKALFNRGFTKGLQGDVGEEIADYNALLALPDTPIKQQAQALLNRGVAKSQQGDLAGGIADYDAVLALPDVSADQQAYALVNRAKDKSQQGDLIGALSDCDAVLAQPDAPIELQAGALFNRAFIKCQQGDLVGGTTDYDALLALPDAPADQQATALVNRGVSKGLQGDLGGAIIDFETVLTLPYTSAGQQAQAMFNRGVTKGLQGDIVGAITDYSEVLECADAPIQERLLASVYLLRRSAGTILPTAQIDKVVTAAVKAWTHDGADSASDDIAALLRTAVCPELAVVWPQLWRGLWKRLKDTAARGMLETLRPVAEVLEGGGPTVLQRLRSEERAFAELILKEFDPPEED